MRLPNISTKEKKRLLADKSLWPKCVNCGGPIAIKSNEAVRAWLYETKFCSQRCHYDGKVAMNRKALAHLLEDKTKWPVCQNPACRKLIPPTKENLKNGVNRWVKRRFCNLDCSTTVVPQEAAKTRGNGRSTQFKTCTSCKTVFKRPMKMRTKTWWGRKLCDFCSEHKINTRNIHGKVTIGHAFGKPIKPGFYVFDPKPRDAGVERKNPYPKCMDKDLVYWRDQEIDRVIAELNA